MGSLNSGKPLATGRAKAMPLRAENLLPVSYDAMSQKERSRWVLSSLSALGVEASA